MQNTEEQKRIVLDFIKGQKLAVLATSGDGGKPEAATVAMSEIEGLELIFGCYSTARKYKNLIRNPKVAVVFGEGKVSVQYEGAAREVTGEEAKKAQDVHIVKHAGSSKHLSHPAEKYFIITPKWVRFMDHGAKPDVEFEITF